MPDDNVLAKVMQKLFGTASSRFVKRSSHFIARIRELEADYQQLSDDELYACSERFREQLAERLGQIFEKPVAELLREALNETEDRRVVLKQRVISGLNEATAEILPEAFAAVREAGRRLLQMRHFDVQMIGGRVLHEGKIAEMATGEGKTLVATLPVYINCLLGLKVHVVSVNDYLVQRDRDWMAPLYEKLGLTVGAIQSSQDTMGQARREQYTCNITYGTNNELGFDYLRDNMKLSRDQQVQGPLHYAIIDEVDSILIDEARTPLIISGPARDDVSRYRTADQLARSLVSKQTAANNETARRISDVDALKKRAPGKEHQVEQAIAKFKSDPNWLSEEEADLIAHKQLYIVERDRKSAHLTHTGVTAAQEEAKIGSFYVGANMEWPHLIENSLRARVVYERDKEYVVQDDEVVIVDEFTGRLMHGRQWSDGLHQAVEAKENVTVKQESQTLATITLQNFFKLYGKLAGMTGTAVTESEEFMKIYRLEVMEIPTNRPINRRDYNDRIYRTLEEKLNAIVDEVRTMHMHGFPADPFIHADALSALIALYKGLSAESAQSLGLTTDKVADCVARMEDALKTFNKGEGETTKLIPTLQFVLDDLAHGRPVLVGTTSIENNEKLSSLLTRRYGIEHEVLNAKQHEREADIVAKAGHRHEDPRDKKRLLGNVTIATNMAGRGTDIKLEQGVVYAKCKGDLGPGEGSDSARAGRGWQEEGVTGTKCCVSCPDYDARTNCAHCWKPKVDPRFPALGRTYCPLMTPCGLHIVGTERHESRRIDNQLRGRAGRQGDPGSSRFFLSLQDELMQFFAGEWTLKMLNWLGMEEGMAIEHKRISKGVERAQKKVEERNFGIRKNLLEYDQVMDYQRQVFYGRRQKILEARGLDDIINEMLEQSLDQAINTFLDKGYAASSAADWARSAMDVSIEPGRLPMDSFDELDNMVRTEAKAEAAQTINTTIGEYMDPEVPSEQWDLQGLARWAMSRFNVNLSQTQLRRSDAKQIEEDLVAAAGEQIDKADLEPLQKYLDPDYGRTMLIDWVRAKFELDVKLDAIREMPPEEVHDLIWQRMQQAYHRREVEYPVDFVLDQVFGESGTDSATAADALVNWANQRYEIGWTVDDVQGRRMDELRSDLVAAAEAWLSNGKLDTAIDEAMREHSLDELPAWARERFGPRVNITAGDEQQAREQLFAAWRHMLRFELSQLERFVLLQIHDAAWKDHLYTMDHLKTGIGLRGYAERDPKLEYKKEGTLMFGEMLDNIAARVTDMIYKARLTSSAQMRSVWQVSHSSHEQVAGMGGFSASDRDAAMRQQGEQKTAKIQRSEPKVKPNDPCPCGSGKKYKRCHGRAQ